MKLLSLDQSTKITGWAVFENEVLTKYGEIDLSKNTDPSGRFQDMCNAVQDLIHKEKPDFVVFEEVAMQVNAYALITLARLQGFILAVCFNRQIEHYIYSPGAWRKAIGFKQGKGHARKDLKKQAIAYCKEHHGVDLDEDRADAVCIGDAFTKTYLKEAD